MRVGLVNLIQELAQWEVTEVGGPDHKEPCENMAQGLDCFQCKKKLNGQF